MADDRIVMPDDVIRMLLMRQNAPAGSPADIVKNRFDPVFEAYDKGTINELDLSGGEKNYMTPEDMLYTGRVNPAGMEAFEASAPVSQNVDDRRNETINEMIARHFRKEAPPTEPEQTSLTGLPAPIYIDDKTPLQDLSGDELLMQLRKMRKR